METKVCQHSLFERKIGLKTSSFYWLDPDILILWLRIKEVVLFSNWILLFVFIFAITESRGYLYVGRQIFEISGFPIQINDF